MIIGFDLSRITFTVVSLIRPITLAAVWPICVESHPKAHAEIRANLSNRDCYGVSLWILIVHSQPAIQLPWNPYGTRCGSCTLATGLP